MPIGLDQIVRSTRQRVAELRRNCDVGVLERKAEQHVPRGFRRALEAKGKTGPAIIAELKKASPSRGLIRADFDAASLAGEFELAGAAALSVLTDEKFFQGSLDNLARASARTSLPCLRKDFIVDELQIVQARACGADAILLIVAALSQQELETLAESARRRELDVLCELHDEQELTRALDAGCSLIGVNSRDLRTFRVDLQTAYRLAEQLPSNALPVAESGIHNAADLVSLRAVGYQAFLIGESLMRAKFPAEALKTLLAESLRTGR